MASTNMAKHAPTRPVRGESNVYQLFVHIDIGWFMQMSIDLIGIGHCLFNHG